MRVEIAVRNKKQEKQRLETYQKKNREVFMKVVNLQVNHLVHPVGIDGTSVRISWNLEGGIRQSAYQVSIIDEHKNIAETSGRVQRQDMVYIAKKDIPWKSRAEIEVKVWDEKGQAGEPASISVITGISGEDWKANWINPEINNDGKERQRASYLRKSFWLTKEQVAQARCKGAFLYATCHGIMNITINDREITNRQLMPGTQQYDKRLKVETIAVEEFLTEGENHILVSLGDGWYRGSMGMVQAKNVYGTDIALLLQMDIAGTTVVITDETWEATQNGPIGRNDFMAGEEYDARKELLREFHPVKIENFGYGNLVANDTVSVVPKETFQGKWIDTPKGEKIIDFGQNLVGYVCLDFEGESGKKLTLIHGETLDLKGNFMIENFQSLNIPVKQQIDYICKDGRNQYHPTMTYMGFRYVKVEADFEIPAEAFTAVAIYSDMRTTAHFECGVDEVNRLFKNALWSMKGNFVDVPTDCPTREKSGYSGDCQAYVHTAMYLMDCYPVYAKWIREQVAGQYQDGVIPQIAPKKTPPGKKESISGIISMEGGIGWSDSVEIVPYRMMRRYGDSGLILEIYEALKKWTAYEIKRARKTHLCNLKMLPRKHRKYMIDKGWMWGEWLEPEQDDRTYMVKLVQRGDPEVGTAFFYMNLRYMEEMASVLGKEDDEHYYHELAERAKTAYRAVYLEKGKVKEEKRQCRFVRPIAHDLLTEKEKFQAAKELAGKISENGNHLNTGFLTTHELCRSLSRYGQNKTAYDLLLQRKMPGWLYSVTKGCTTIPESWDCFREDGTPKNSFNHYAYGAIAGWMMDCVCGINIENGKIVIQPYPDE